MDSELTQPRIPRVYVANYAAHDYSDACRYGELHFVTRGFVSFQGLDRVKYQVAQGLRDTDEEDWLALSGTNIINVLAAVLWYQKHSRIKILNYDKNTKEYREIIVTPDNSKVLFQVVAAET